MIDINKLHDITKILLKNRNIETESEIFDFFYQDIYSLSNPFAIKSIVEFIDRVRQAIDDKEHILIYGDKDADGITASAIMYNTLKVVADNVQGFIPTLKTGYGLSKAVIEEYVAEGVSLIITVDCGISNIEEVAYARELGVDIIVTDHHDIPNDIPDAYLVFNPKIEDSGFDNKNFSGCAVAFKLMQAFVFSYTKYYNRNFIIFEYEISKNENCINYVRAMQVKNFILQADIFSLERTSDGYMMDGFDELVSEEEGLEELSSYMFENDDVSFVITGSNQKFESLLLLYKKYDIYIAEYQEVLNLIDIAKKCFDIDYKTNNTLELFAIALRINIYKYEGLKYCSMHIRLVIFMKLFFLKQKKITSYFKKKSILVAFGTVADVVSALGENRIFIKSGLDELNITEHKRYKILLEKTLISRGNQIDTQDIGWRIAPFINAAGRLGEPQKAFEFLTSDDETTLENLADEIYELNKKRRTLTELNFKLIEKEIKKINLDEHPIIVMKSKEIEQGFTGLIAGKVLTMYGKTAVIMYESDEHQCIGSIRSRSSHNVRYMLEKNKSFLLAFGGHKNAAGFSLDVKHYDDFVNNIFEHANEYNFGEEVEELKYEMPIEFSSIDMDLAQELELLKPFGVNNLEPIFYTKNVYIMDIRNIGKGNKIHALIDIKSDGKILHSIKWSMSESDFDLLLEKPKLDIMYKIRLDNYKNVAEIKLFIENYKILS